MDLTPQQQQWRVNRKLVVEAVSGLTGSWRDGHFASSVQAFCEDPINATRDQLAYVGALRLWFFYASPDQPDPERRQSLWRAVVDRLGHPRVPDPGGWDGLSDITRFHAIAEWAINRMARD
jgi:hypothetical protein